jgi:P4 family phage/plasmid primase-like protien
MTTRRAPSNVVPLRKLSPAHAKMLRDSAISPEVIKERGYFTIETRADYPGGILSTEVPPGLSLPALVIPWHDVEGKRARYQFRPDVPRRGDKRKYLFKTGAANVLDVPRRVQPLLADPTVPLYVTEGSKQVDAGVSAGLAVIGLAGCWGWRGKNKKSGKTALPDWEAVALNGRDLFLAFDSDTTRKPKVRDALRRLRAFLEKREARVSVVDLPDLPGREKTGLDDYLAAGHDADDVRALVRANLPPRAKLAAVDPFEAAPEPDDFFGDAGFVSPLLGEYLQRRHHVLAAKGDATLYRYEGGVYRACEQALRAEINRLLGDRWKPPHANAAIEWLRSTPPSAALHVVSEPYVVNVANGLLDLRAPRLTLRPHSPDFVSTVQIPVAYEAGARCPKIRAFLDEMVPRDAIPLVFELFGYALVSGNPYQVAVLILGEGENGKGTLLRLFEALVGEENYSALTLHNLTERFGPADLHGKLLNTCDDLDARSVDKTDFFKMLTGGGVIRGETKGVDAFNFRGIALPVFAANEAPLTSDQSRGWFRRWLILPMDRMPTRRDPDLAAKLTAPAELRGLLAEAVIAVRRLLARGRFDTPPSVRRAGETYRERLDSVRAFVRDACVCREDLRSVRADLYREYATHVEGERGRPVKAATFYERLERDFGVRRAKVHGENLLVGIATADAARIVDDIARNSDAAGGSEGEEGEGGTRSTARRRTDHTQDRTRGWSADHPASKRAEPSPSSPNLPPSRKRSKRPVDPGPNPSSSSRGKGEGRKRRGK